MGDRSGSLRQILDPQKNPRSNIVPTPTQNQWPIIWHYIVAGGKKKKYKEGIIIVNILIGNTITSHLTIYINKKQDQC